MMIITIMEVFLGIVNGNINPGQTYLKVFHFHLDEGLV